MENFVMLPLALNHQVLLYSWKKIMEQILIAFTGVTAIWLTQQSKEAWKRYACLFGLAGQPFWFYSAYQAEQWGIFILCCFYTYSWALGVRNNWILAKAT